MKTRPVDNPAARDRHPGGPEEDFHELDMDGLRSMAELSLIEAGQHIFGGPGLDEPQALVGEWRALRPGGHSLFSASPASLRH